MEENKWLDDMPNRPLWIDINRSWDKKSRIELVSMIKEELIGDDDMWPRQTNWAKY